MMHSHSQNPSLFSSPLAVELVMNPPPFANDLQGPSSRRGSLISSSRSSYRASFRGSTTALENPIHRGYFRSRRIDNTGIEKPWLKTKDSRKKWHTIGPILGVLLGIVFTGLLCWYGYSSVANYKYCLIFDDDFSSGTLNPSVWTKEVEVGGFGNGQFEYTTNTDENVFIQNGELWIKPTLQDSKLIQTNNVLNLTAQGICTGNTFLDCYATTNVTNGTIINPVKSGRINTKKGAKIQYGRVEVTARFPAGDWLWPAIWMLPTNDTYGPWPASGEIDIAECRGNNHTYPMGGNDYAGSALHWGPNHLQDAYLKTFNNKRASHTTYADTYHTFGLEWSPSYLFTYIDGRLIQSLHIPFKSFLWPYGKFPPATPDGVPILDPWSQTGRFNTPFDQTFYLILNVAVGGTNGWWTDGIASKPWVDASPTAKLDFWNAQSQWFPTWAEKGQMQVKHVKMWQQAGYQGCVATS